MNKDLILEHIINFIKYDIDEIMEKSNIDYIIDWDDGTDLGLWHYDFALNEKIETIYDICNELDKIDYITTYISNNYDEYKYTLCCYIDIRNLEYRLINDYETEEIIVFWDNTGLLIPLNKEVYYYDYEDLL